MLVGLDEPFSNVETETETGFTTALQDLRTGFDSTLATADGEITKAIDAGVTHADAALHRLDGKMDEAAAKAAWRHDHPVLATLRDIGGFIAGLVVGIVAVVALVVVAIVAFKVIVAGLVALGLSMAVASAVAALAGLGLLLFGIYQAHQERVRNGEADNWATWGHALLDVFGVTGLINAFTSPDLSPYERGLAIGWFAGEIAATFFGGRLHKLISARLPSRIRNPVRGSLWRRQQAPRLTEANDPTPRLRAASDDPAVDTDAIKPQQARVRTEDNEANVLPSAATQNPKNQFGQYTHKSPDELKFSQKDVGPTTSDGLTIDDLTESMRTNGWKGQSLNVVEMPDGSLTSLDNRRLLAARQAGLKEVPTTIHQPNDKFPEQWAVDGDFILDRPIRELPDGSLVVGGKEGTIVYPKGHTARTYYEAVLIRSANQGNITLITGEKVRFPLGGRYEPPIIRKGKSE